MEPDRDYQALSRAARGLVGISLIHMLTSNWVSLNDKVPGHYEILHMITAVVIVVLSALILLEPWL
jgi:hypothetical protein